MRLLREDYRARGRTHAGGVYRRRRTRRFGAWFAVMTLAAAIVAVAAYLQLRPRLTRPAVSPPLPARDGAERSKAAKKPVAARGKERFEFYNLLPKAEVEVPSRALTTPHAGTTPQPVQMPGTYFLQIGSFATAGEAQEMQRRLANLRIRGAIQSVPVEGRVVQNVRIGPLEDLVELNRVRRVLRDTRIEAGLVRVGD